MGSWTVTSLVPSGKVPSTCSTGIISATPGITSSVVRMVAPNSMSSATERPSRAPSRISSLISATASGWLSAQPRARRRRASSAAVKMVSRSVSVGVSSIVGHPDQLLKSRTAASSWRAAATSASGA